MTRLLVLSDLHLEMSVWDFPDRLPAHDVAILAGDVSAPLVNSVRKLARVRDAGLLRGEVVLVPGNHEFYGADMLQEMEQGRREARDYGIHLLDGDEARFGDLRVLGATLWTDYGLYGDPLRAMAEARVAMNDHRLIRIGGRAFAPEDAREIHRVQVGWLAERLRSPHDGRTVVVTHHGPSRASVHERYGTDPLNAAFSSDLDWLIGEAGPEIWIHGHTHHSFDYRIGRTRVLCNPKGYGPSPRRGVENADGFVEDLVVEV